MLLIKLWSIKAYFLLEKPKKYGNNNILDSQFSVCNIGQWRDDNDILQKLELTLIVVYQMCYPAQAINLINIKEHKDHELLCAH